MPIYEYQCHACGHELEAIQKMADEALVHCPECNKPSLKKLISAAGFQLKGTGWYETDFKNSGKKPESKSDNKSEGRANNKDKPKTSPANKSEGSTSSQAA